jgi:hypothetical protein
MQAQSSQENERDGENDDRRHSTPISGDSGLGMFSAATPKKTSRRVRRSQSRSLAGTPRPSPPGSVASSRLRDDALPAAAARTPRAYHAATDDTLAPEEDFVLQDSVNSNKVLVSDDSHSVVVLANLPVQVQQVLSSSGAPPPIPRIPGFVDLLTAFA